MYLFTFKLSFVRFWTLRPSVPQMSVNFTASVSSIHSVEISKFFYHSGFTWNQLWSPKDFKNCFGHLRTSKTVIFATFCSYEFWFEEKSALRKCQIFPKLQIRAFEIVKITFLRLQNLPKVISRKIFEFPHCVI